MNSRRTVLLGASLRDHPSSVGSERAEHDRRLPGPQLGEIGEARAEGMLGGLDGDGVLEVLRRRGPCPKAHVRRLQQCHLRRHGRAWVRAQRLAQRLDENDQFFELFIHHVVTQDTSHRRATFCLGQQKVEDHNLQAPAEHALFRRASDEHGLHAEFVLNSCAPLAACGSAGKHDDLRVRVCVLHEWSAQAAQGATTTSSRKALAMPSRGPARGLLGFRQYHQ
ncbi:hypothetical protein T492DRAFT_999033 [Pavlovales sp. CCMP2436]|nr:hypothetical protein T492DRAFT_999033 [Pavlovales sp. CCMP2436]